MKRGTRGAGDALEAVGDRDPELGAQAARGGDCLEHRGAIGGIKRVDELVVAADQLTQRGDLLVAGGGIAARPVRQLRHRCGEALATGQ